MSSYDECAYRTVIVRKNPNSGARWAGFLLRFDAAGHPVPGPEFRGVWVDAESGREAWRKAMHHFKIDELDLKGKAGIKKTIKEMDAEYALSMWRWFVEVQKKMNYRLV